MNGWRTTSRSLTIRLSSRRNDRTLHPLLAGPDRSHPWHRLTTQSCAQHLRCHSGSPSAGPAVTEIRQVEAQPQASLYIPVKLKNQQKSVFLDQVGEILRNVKWKTNYVYEQQVTKQPPLTDGQVQFCHHAIELLSKSGNREMDFSRMDQTKRMMLAADLLERLAEEVENRALTTSEADLYKLKQVLPTRCYTHVSRGWAETKVWDALPRTLDVVQRLHDRYERNPAVYNQPHHSTHSSVLYAASFRSDPRARELADKFMTKLETTYRKLNKFLPEHLYNEWIFVHAVRADSEYGAAAAAEDVLMRLSELSTTSASAPSPSTDSFNRVLRAWVNSPEDSAMDRALMILKLMTKVSSPDIESRRRVRPNAASFGTLISAHAKRRQPKKAEVIWDMAVQQFSKQQQPAAAASCESDSAGDADFSHQQPAATGSHDEEGEQDVEEVDNTSQDDDVLGPPVDLTDCLNSTLFAWVNAMDTAGSGNLVGEDNKDTNEQKEHPTEAVERLFASVPGIVEASNGQIVLRPNGTTLESRMQVHLRQTPPSVVKATTLLHAMADAFLKHTGKAQNGSDMPPALPPKRLFHNILRAWLRTHVPLNAGLETKAEQMFALLEKILKLHRKNPSDDCAPSAAMFTMCIQVAAAQEDNLAMALKVLSLAEEKGLTQKHAYACIIQLLVRKAKTPDSSQRENSALMAAQLLQRMAEQGSSCEGAEHSSGLCITVLVALARSRTVKAAQTAETLLEQFSSAYWDEVILTQRQFWSSRNPKETERASLSSGEDAATTTRMVTAVIEAYSNAVAVLAGRQNKRNIPPLQEEEEHVRKAVEKVLAFSETLEALERKGKGVRDEVSSYLVFQTLAAATALAQKPRRLDDQQQEQHHNDSSNRMQRMAGEARQHLSTMFRLCYEEERLELRPTTRCLDASLYVMLHEDAAAEAAASFVDKLFPDHNHRHDYDLDRRYLPSASCIWQVAQACRRRSSSTTNSPHSTSHHHHDHLRQLAAKLERLSDQLGRRGR